nr:LuxR C-terminal-related transcriptional regulator [Geodermatophilus aquaeductus]
MAAKFTVSVNTVKTHLRGIYAELGVPSRSDAVTRARDAGLLP